LVSLLLLLQHRGRVTAAELAEELEVSVRTIYRDLEALSAAGVPVYAEAGRHGGCQLVDGYRTRLTGLTRKEAEALFAAGVSGPAGELGLGTVLGAAQLKLLAALPKELADRAASASQRFHVDAPGWFRSTRNDPHLSTLAAAVWDDCRVRITYRHPGGDEGAERLLDPLGLVSKGGVWYLVARRDGELRTYRVSRVESVAPLDEHFERPADFDLGAWWRTSVATYERTPPPLDVDARCTEAALGDLRRWSRYYGAVVRDHDDDPDRDGRFRARLAFEHVEDAFAELIRFGSDVEVLAPTALRQRLADTGARLAALYT
jgi:predicted DNA-binding transcriptional regulator YafY